jgi:hypothetical protein
VSSKKLRAMFDTILLLSGVAEQSVFPRVLLGHNPLLTVITVRNAADLAALNSDVLRRARLIAFVTPEIVPASILNRLGYGAISSRHLRSCSGGNGLCPPRAIVLAHGRGACHGCGATANASNQMGEQEIFPPRLSDDL